ncbi:DUF4314 domain-containing protein [Streptococcus suis]|uniref:DUF4314 domain-containing protein n=1 Tax=Streptococcus suis TaxID=1307 RepID=UPI00209BBB70|nr:DUF4314 domain-containing protein [Streptococcus suis]MCO8221075.1 DUF4314 domain-containing protein [Streptococcus suis]HEM3512552.1 DUF4314 domain-containing protein [Streptococcus suis]
MINVDRIKKRYPVGTRVRLVMMEDPFSPPIGTLGTVKGVDDIGSLLVEWDNGSSLNVLHGIDKVVMVEPQRVAFIRAIYDYLIHGYNGFVFDSGKQPVPLTHEEVIALMTRKDAKEEIDVYVDECSYFHLEPSLQLTIEEIERVIFGE